LRNRGWVEKFDTLYSLPPIKKAKSINASKKKTSAEENLEYDKDMDDSINPDDNNDYTDDGFESVLFPSPIFFFSLES
jgi:hypothetical protein